MGYFKNFLLELKAWMIVRREYRKNKPLFDSVGLKKDWGGRLYRVINRDPLIKLGSDEDQIYLHKETAEIWAVMVKLNLADILAYELKPLEEVNQLEDGKEEFENGYLVILTPAWRLDKQYVTIKSIIGVTIFFAAVIFGLIYAFTNWIIPYIQTLL